MREGAASPGPSMRDRMTRAHTLLVAAIVATTSLTALADGDAAAGRTLYQMRCNVPDAKDRADLIAHLKQAAAAK